LVCFYFFFGGSIVTLLDHLAVDQMVDATEYFASSKETTLISSYRRESWCNIFLFILGLRNVATLTPFFYVSRTAQLILKVFEKLMSV